MSIEVGQLAYVKTTEEPVFVMKIESIPPDTPEEKYIYDRSRDIDYSRFSNTTVMVRRPKLTDQGIVHIFEQFLIEELESRQDKEQRVFNEMEGIKAQFNTASRTAMGTTLGFPETKN